MSKSFPGVTRKYLTPDCYVLSQAGAKIIASADKPASAIAALRRHAEWAEADKQDAGRDWRRAA